MLFLNIFERIKSQSIHHFEVMNQNEYHLSHELIRIQPPATVGVEHIEQERELAVEIMQVLLAHDEAGSHDLGEFVLNPDVRVLQLP